ncbi:MAG: coproporphyrinogen dehydrogenase HemZ [Eubacteriales bacterium]|nr:coproporphyrinogen dehydrogenase HemZ [Eubacteriales bacterium]
MTALRAALRTPLPGFANDLCDVLKLFYQVESFSVNEDGADGEGLLHEFTQTETAWESRFTFLGCSLALSEERPHPDAEHRELVEKRLQKRLCKRSLYALLKEVTGAKPPWGSLTGIRPTRLLYEAMAEGLTLEQAQARLVDVFDVLPEKAALLGQIVETQRALSLPAIDDIDVYIGIPFCRTRCLYCSFPGEALGKGRQVEPYLAALLKEMEYTAALIARAGLRLRAVYVGGGTPTALPDGAFARLMERAAALFAGAREFTVEAGRPDTFSPAKLAAMRAAGVTRVSVNPQTMNDATLRLIGRDHTAAQIIDVMRAVRESGFEDVNMDVIAGLPGESAADFAHTMEEIERLRPDSLTVHTLAIKRASRLHREGAQAWRLPDAQTVTEMVRMGGETAARLGLSPYYLYRQKYMAGQQQNVGYSTPGRACLYNVDIMEENGSILACGAGAISKRVFIDRQLRIERAPNVSDVAVYIARVDDMLARKEELFMNS